MPTRRGRSGHIYDQLQAFQSANGLGSGWRRFGDVWAGCLADFRSGCHDGSHFGAPRCFAAPQEPIVGGGGGRWMFAC